MKMRRGLILGHDTGWRFKNLSSSDEFVILYREYKKTGQPEYVGEAIEIRQDAQFKMYVECMILAGCNDSECAEYFGCTGKSIDFYKAMFFDVEPIMQSKARLYKIVRESPVHERSLKMSSLRFGKSFIQRYIGVTDMLPSEDLDKFKLRLHDGLVVKALGHELVSSSSPDNLLYMKMMSMISQEDRDNKKNKQHGDVMDIANHFSQFFAQ